MTSRGALVNAKVSNNSPWQGDEEAEVGGRTAELELDTLDRTRRSHFRLIALFVLALCAAGAVMSQVVYSDNLTGQAALLSVVIGMTGTYLYIFFRVRTGPLRPWMGWLQSTLEMMAVGAVIVTDLLNTGAPYAFTSGATTIIVFGVVLSSLRLMPYLAIYSSVLGVAVYLVAYAYTYATMPAGDGFSRAVLLPNIALRCLVVLMTGIVGALLSRSLRTAIARAISSMRDRERVHMAFGRYVDTRVVDRILKGDLKLTAERRSITVMFVDIRGFTRLSEAGDPEVLFRKLSETLDAFAIEVQREGGFVNKFLGDGLMAIFGAPESHPDHARRAVRAALQVEEAARQRREDGRFADLRIGIGIHTGEAMVGDLGGNRREYTAIGDVVNVAARVEAANKSLGTSILITGAVMPAVASEVTLKPHLDIALRGRAASVDLYQVRTLSWSAGDITSSGRVKSTG